MSSGGAAGGATGDATVRDARVAVHVAPKDNPWADTIAAAVEAGGARVGTLEESRGLVWLDVKVDTLDAHLHDGIEWMQFRMAGVDALIAAGVIDDRRVFTTARGIYADGVAEHAVALILASLGGLRELARRDAPGATVPTRSLAGLTVAVVGAGGIGAAIVALLAPLGARIIGVTRTGRDVPGCDVSLSADRMDEVWPVADVVVLAAPATAATARLVDAAVIDVMRDDAVLVNIARGSLVDTDALTVALREGRLGAAALDVTDPEPLPDDHPLWAEPRAIVTPHSANPGSAQLVRLSALVTENVRRFVAGGPLLGAVDLEAGY
jgi:phosphoglycerate dehydrogenase-like enzyme